MPLDRLRALLPVQDVDALARLYRDGNVRVWGEPERHHVVTAKLFEGSYHRLHHETFAFARRTTFNSRPERRKTLVPKQRHHVRLDDPVVDAGVDAVGGGFDYGAGVR